MPRSSIVATCSLAIARFLTPRCHALAKTDGPTVTVCCSTPCLATVVENAGTVGAGNSGSEDIGDGQWTGHVAKETCIKYVYTPERLETTFTHDVCCLQSLS